MRVVTDKYDIKLEFMLLTVKF